jgi:predicted 3-demethylubiquinone-9 3-methyltransferase (glyoxalase superfamily)/uncharacterized protein YndB with AHSA1/START domain
MTMERKTFDIVITASPEAVWQVLWNDVTYRRWTSVFHEGSYAESDWKEGSKILFLAPGGDGMASRIAVNREYSEMAFQHLGIVKNGVEDYDGEEVKNWAGAMEVYRLEPLANGATKLTAELDVNDEYADYFLNTFPKALQIVKDLAEGNHPTKITPFLWFDGQAEEAADFYVSVFKNSEIKTVTRSGDSVMVVNFSLDGQEFSALNGGPEFKVNPSISFYVVCETEAETDEVWRRLSEGGSALMPLQKYDWSEKYGWVQDRFGVSWQISLGKMEDTGQKFTPSLLFTGGKSGRGEEAVHFYTSVFSPSSITGILRYGPGEPGREGTVKHAQFTLHNETFMIMDSPMNDPFTFNEGLSFLINCETQAEVDYYWGKLIADGGAESMCGWLKDKFGVSWQVVPAILPKLLSHPDPAKAQRATAAMLKMRKIEIDKLTQAAGTGNTVTIENMVNAPVAKVWQLWTEARHVQNWNNASDDWHTPKAVNDLRVGGRFVYTMAAKDGSAAFDFCGVYDEVVENSRIDYTMDDGRMVENLFEERDGKTHVLVTFETENTHSQEMQRAGWQAILDNFKKYAEG